MVCCTVISHIEGYGANPITVPLYQIGELRRVTRRRDETMPWPNYPMVLRVSSAHEEGGERPAASTASASARPKPRELPVINQTFDISSP